MAVFLVIAALAAVMALIHHLFLQAHLVSVFIPIITLGQYNPELHGQGGSLHFSHLLPNTLEPTCPVYKDHHIYVSKTIWQRDKYL